MKGAERSAAGRPGGSLISLCSTLCLCPYYRAHRLIDEEFSIESETEVHRYCAYY